jgi:hypothetical protein
MKKLLILGLIVLLASCASVRKVEPGNRAVGERLVINLEGPWNHLDFPAVKPAEIWTMEGVTVDELRIYSGIRDGQVIHPEGPVSGKEVKKFAFRSAMESDEIVSMFEGTLTRDGSSFRLVKLEPYTFGGRKGYRFDYELIRKVDNVQQLGMGFGAVDKGELFALVYHAPRLTFFPRHKARVEAMAKAAVIR